MRLFIDVIRLIQEFWVGNEELVNMYDTRLGDAGYINFKLARTNNRGDGELLVSYYHQAISSLCFLMIAVSVSLC